MKRWVLKMKYKNRYWVVECLTLNHQTIGNVQMWVVRLFERAWLVYKGQLSIVVFSVVRKVLTLSGAGRLALRTSGLYSSGDITSRNTTPWVKRNQYQTVSDGNDIYMCAQEIYSILVYFIIYQNRDLSVSIIVRAAGD